MLDYITTKAAVIVIAKQMGGREAFEMYVREQIPMGWRATIEEITESILYLASDRSSFMTGHVLVVDGGECIDRGRYQRALTPD